MLLLKENRVKSLRLVFFSASPFSHEAAFEWLKGCNIIKGGRSPGLAFFPNFPTENDFPLIKSPPSGAPIKFGIDVFSSKVSIDFSAADVAKELSVSEVSGLAIEILKSLEEKFGAFLTRIGAIVIRDCGIVGTDELVSHFCRTAFAQGPFLNLRAFELHLSKRFSEFQANFNVWSRFRLVAEQFVSPANKTEPIDTTRLIIEQDVNSVSTQQISTGVAIQFLEFLNSIYDRELSVSLTT